MGEKKYLFREVEPECVDFSSYFDDDGMKKASGDYNNIVFIFKVGDRSSNIFNEDEWKEVIEKMKYMKQDFSDLDDKTNVDKALYACYKDILQDNGYEYTEVKETYLKEFFKIWDGYERPSDVATFLSIVTDKLWKHKLCQGYTQSDWCEIVYCADKYKEQEISEIGDMWLGCGKEFCFVDGDYETYGYYVADSELHHGTGFENDEEQYKKILCGWKGVPVEETQIAIIVSSHTVTQYSYETY